MKLANIASLDPAITSTGRAGLRAVSANDRAMWEEMQSDWERFAVESQRAISDATAEANPDDKAVDETDPDRVGEDRAVQTTTRIGQNFSYNRTERLQRTMLHHRIVVTHFAKSRPYHPLVR
jgi:hypothetical protein